MLSNGVGKCKTTVSSQKNILPLLISPNYIEASPYSSNLFYYIAHQRVSPKEINAVIDTVSKLENDEGFSKASLFLLNNFANLYQRAKSVQYKNDFKAKLTTILCDLAIRYKNRSPNDIFTQEQIIHFKSDVCNIQDLLKEVAISDSPVIPFLASFNSSLVDDSLVSLYNRITKDDAVQSSINENKLGELIEAILHLGNNSLDRKRKLISEIISHCGANIAKSSIKEDDYIKLLKLTLEIIHSSFNDNDGGADQEQIDNRQTWADAIISNHHCLDANIEIIMQSICKINNNWKAIDEKHPAFLREYLISANNNSLEISDGICLAHPEYFTGLFLQKIIGDEREKNIIVKLVDLKRSLSNRNQPSTHIDNILDELFINVEFNHQLYVLIVEYISRMDPMSENANNFLQANIFELLERFQSEILTCTSALTIKIIKLLSEQIYKTTTPEQCGLILQFLSNDKQSATLQNSKIILQRISQLSGLTDDALLQVITMVIKKGLIDLLADLLRQERVKNNAQINKYIENYLSERLASSLPEAKQVKGVLFAYQNKLLPQVSEFDFMLTDYAHYCYQKWQTTVESNGKIELHINVSGSENSMLTGKSNDIIRLGQKQFPNLNIAAAYDDCIKYIGDELEKLEGHRDALDDEKQRKNFVPEKRKADDSIEIIKQMGEKEKQIARLHTALRLLKRDPLPRSGSRDNSSFDPYIQNFNLAVAYCYQAALTADTLDAFIHDLAYLRREHNLDKDKSREFLSDDFTACQSGVEGRLYQSYVLSNNILSDNRSENAEKVIGLNSTRLHAIVKDHVFKSFKGIKNNFLSESPKHLANLIYAYQFKISFVEGLDDDEARRQVVNKARRSLQYILEHEIDYQNIYNRLISEYNLSSRIKLSDDNINAIKKIIQIKLEELFELNDVSNNAGQNIDAWEGLQNIVIRDSYPDLLLHYLYAPPAEGNELNFSQLVAVAEQMDPSVRETFQKKLIQNLPNLAHFCMNNGNDDKVTILIKNIHSLQKENVLSTENINTFFESFFTNIASSENFDKPLIRFLTSAGPEFPRDTVGARLLKALKNILSNVKYQHNNSLRNLFKYIIDKSIISTDDLTTVMQEQAEIYLQNNNHTAYARLADFATRFKIDLDLYQESNRGRDKLLADNCYEVIPSLFTSLSKPTDEKNKSFERLKEISQLGNAYASFAIAKLYSDGHAPIRNSSDNSYTWSKSIDLAKTYALMALQQAKVIKNQSLVKEIQGFCQKNFSSSKANCLEEIYYTNLLAVLNANDDKDFKLALANFLLVAKSVDLGALLYLDGEPSSYSSASKTDVANIVYACKMRINLSKLDGLLAVYTSMHDSECFIQSAAGSLYEHDPRCIIPELTFIKRFKQFGMAINLIIHQKSTEVIPAITLEALLKELREKLNITELQLIDWLQQIHLYQTGNQECQGNIKTLRQSKDDVLMTMLADICKRSNFKISISKAETHIAERKDKGKARTEDATESGAPIENHEANYIDTRLLDDAIMKSIKISNNKRYVDIDNVLDYLITNSKMDDSQINLLIDAAYQNIDPSQGSSSSSYTVFSRLPFFARSEMTKEQKLCEIIRSKGMVVRVESNASRSSGATTSNQPPEEGQSSGATTSNRPSEEDRRRHQEMFGFLDNSLYFSDNELRPMNIVLTGDSGVGKSCLLLRMVDDTFTDSFIATIGVDFKFKNTDINGTNVRLQLWDTFGQERFRNIAGYCRKPSLMVICFDLTDQVSFNNLSLSLNEVRRYLSSDTLPILIVGTKCDLKQERVISYQRAKELVDSIPERHRARYIETSAKESINTREAMQAMAYCAAMKAALTPEQLAARERAQERERERESSSVGTNIRSMAQSLYTGVFGRSYEGLDVAATRSSMDPPPPRR